MFFRLLALALPIFGAPPTFKTRSIATDLKGGYQVVPFDVNQDGKPDLIALASGLTELLWFENPSWQRHVLASGLRRMINVAACQGVDEMLVAHEFANQPKGSIGIVSILRPGPDRRQPWAIQEIDRLKTSHRLRCASIDGAGTVFIDAPLAGPKAEAPDYRDRIPLVYYKPGEWKRQLIGNENEGVMHGIYVNRWRKDGGDCILTASFSGIHVYCWDRGGSWRRTEISKGDPSPWPKSGASDIAVGRLGKSRYIAAIEPWHGDQAAIYSEYKGKWTRNVIDNSLDAGHTVITADLNRDGREQAIVGYRGKRRGVRIYSPQDAKGGKWNWTWLDDSIAASACAAADLNGDGRVDLACIGSATTDLKWYENLGKH